MLLAFSVFLLATLKTTKAANSGCESADMSYGSQPMLNDLLYSDLYDAAGVFLSSLPAVLQHPVVFVS